MSDYPATYPCATWEYQEQIEPFLQRSQFDSGWARQRRQWPVTLTALQLTFVMPTAMFFTWSTWMQDNGYLWFNIPLDQYGAGQVTTEVRLTGPLSWTYQTYDTVTVSAPAEVRSA